MQVLNEFPIPSFNHFVDPEVIFMGSANHKCWYRNALNTGEILEEVPRAHLTGASICSYRVRPNTVVSSRKNPTYILARQLFVNSLKLAEDGTNDRNSHYSPTER